MNTTRTATEVAAMLVKLIGDTLDREDQSSVLDSFTYMFQELVEESKWTDYDADADYLREMLPVFEEALDDAEC